MIAELKPSPRMIPAIGPLRPKVRGRVREGAHKRQSRLISPPVPPTFPREQGKEP